MCPVALHKIFKIPLAFPLRILLCDHRGVRAKLSSLPERRLLQPSLPSLSDSSLCLQAQTKESPWTAVNPIKTNQALHTIPNACVI